MSKSHEKVEKNVGLMMILIVVAVSFGGLAQIVPLMYQAEAIEPLPGVEPYPPLELAGRDVYVREGCYNCHSQMVRTLRFETERYGHYSLAGESVYDRPFQWGSKRTGPDLARVGGRYSDDWHRVHLLNPRDVVDDRLALADRFGLSIGFHNCSQDDYLAIISGYAEEFGLAWEASDALEWSRRRGGRSGRVAWHYINELAGRAGTTI